MSYDEILSVVQAAKEGKKIEMRHCAATSAQWLDAAVHMRAKTGFDFYAYDYRIKPEPWEGWLNIYEEGNSSLMPTCSAWKHESSAREFCGKGGRTIHVREVLP